MSLTAYDSSTQADLQNPANARAEEHTKARGNSTGTSTDTSEAHSAPRNQDEEEKRSGEDSSGKSGQDSETEFEVSWDGDDDPGNPRSMTLTRKWIIVAMVSLTSTCVTCASSIYTSTYGQLTVEFDVSDLVATLGLSLFVIGLGLGPVILSPLSEFYGRRPVYIVSLIFYLIWLVPCAVARNIQTMLISRFIDGFCGSAFLTVAGGTVGDMFTQTTLTAPMMVFTASPLMGPELGPMIGGAINSFLSWRWSFYFMIIWTAVMLFLIFVLVPETYSPVLLRRKARTLRQETGNQRWHAPIERMNRSILQTIIRSTYRPILLLVLEPMCLNLSVFLAILLGILYLFFGAFGLVFKANHGFNLWQVGLSFLGMLIGMLIAIATAPLWGKNYTRLVQSGGASETEPGSTEPEYRLPPAILGAVLTPIGLFWFAWTSYPSVHWIVPIIGSAVFGAGVLLVFSGIFTFLVDAYPVYAASALGANSIARSSFAAAFPLFGVQMYEKLGYEWATTLLGFLTLAMAPFPYIFFVYGKRIRAGSKFASAPT